MNLHSKQWFIINVCSSTSYTEEEAKILFDSLTTDQLDLLQELSQNMYNAGYKAAQEDVM